MIALLGTSACAKVGSPAHTIASQSVESIGCKISASEMWSSFHKVVEQSEAFPDIKDLRLALEQEGLKKNLKGAAFERYIDAFIENYQIAIEGIQKGMAPQHIDQWKKALAELEVGVKPTEVHKELQDKLEVSMGILASTEQQLNAPCEATTPGRDPAGEIDPIPTNPLPDSDNSIWEQLKKQTNPEVYGARRTLSITYQSCDVISLRPMISTTPDIEGIVVLPELHPAGGRKRIYGDIDKINSSHYYIGEHSTPKTSCYDIRKTPPIYDFGGKPYTTSSKPKELNFFKDGGTGTKTIGYDCSAFVFSALAIAGLKMSPDPAKPLKADLVHGIGSRAFKEPQSNGLKCLDKIKVTSENSIEDGDIAAINGHVVMLDDVSGDPFGIGKIAKVEDCNSANISTKNFDFTINQSSPSKSGIGVNRYRAKDYVAESSTYKAGLMRYAISACKAKFGILTTIDTTDLSIVRHKKTAECKAEPLVATKEDCISSCKAQ